MTTDAAVPGAFVAGRDVRAAARRGAEYSALLRPAAARLPLVLFVAASVRTGPGAAHFAGGVLLIVASYGLAAAYNDVRDLEIDRANARDLPLVTGSLTVADARRVIAGCAVAVGASQVLLRQPLGLVVSAAAVALSAAYSHPRAAVERRGLWATALLSVTYVGLPLALAGPLPPAARVGAALVGTGAMLLYKDVKDESGDRALGKRTPLVRWGTARLDAVATSMLLLAVIAAAATSPRWPAAVLAGALVAQRRMVAADHRAGPHLRVFQAAVVAGAVGLAGV